MTTNPAHSEEGKHMTATEVKKQQAEYSDAERELAKKLQASFEKYVKALGKCMIEHIGEFPK